VSVPLERAAEFHCYAGYGSNSRIDWMDDLTEQEREQHRHKVRAVFESIDVEELAAVVYFTRINTALRRGGATTAEIDTAIATAIKAHLLDGGDRG